MKLIIRNSNGEIIEREITSDMEFSPTIGEQYFFTGVDNYTFTLTADNSTLDVHFVDNTGEKVNVVLHNMAELIQQNNTEDSFSLESAFGVSTNQAGDKAIDEALNNSELESGEIIEALKEALSMDGTTLAGGAIVDDFQTILNLLDETATGEVQSTAYNPLFEAVLTQKLSELEDSNTDRPENYTNTDGSIERAEGSSINQEETDNNSQGTDPETLIAAASITIGEADISESSTEVVDNAANKEAGIYEKDGNYYKVEIQEVDSGVVDVAALRELGFTIDNEGNIFKINDDKPKQLVEQEFERVVTKVVEVEPIMKEVTQTSTVERLGEAHIDDGAVIDKKSGVDFDFAEPTSNIEIEFGNFNTGTSKISFYDSEGNQVGDTVNTSHRNGVEDYVVPDGAVGVRVYNNTNSNEFEVESISYRGLPTTEVIETTGLVIDVEAMEGAGYKLVDTEAITLEQTDDIKKIGNVGNNKVDGFNPEDTETSQVFDFGSELAHQKVTISIDMEVKGTWDNNIKSTNDYFSISANGQEVDVHHYSNKSTGHETDDVEVISSRGSDISYQYEVYLDENGQVQLEFMVASTARSEVVNIENIEVTYNGMNGWVEEVIETETYTQSVLVDAPAEEVDPSDIPGGIPTVIETKEVEVETQPQMTTITEIESVEYPIDFMVKLAGDSGENTLGNITVDNLPEGSTLSGDNVTNNGDGTYSVTADENGEVSAVLSSETELSEDLINSVSAQINVTSESGEISTIVVNGTGELSFLGDAKMGDFEDVTSNSNNINTINLENETNQTLTLSVEDILVSNDENEMVILGDNGDVIDLEGEGWIKQEDVSVEGEEGTFNRYSSTSTDGTTVNIYVEDDITVQTNDLF